MSLLTDKDILREVELGIFKIEPFDASLVQPASIDLRLDNAFIVFESSDPFHVIDPAMAQRDTTLEIRDNATPFVLTPGQFILASTYERVTMPSDLAGRVEGKSSIGRLGLAVHITAGFIDPGFSGHITLELSNVNRYPIKLWPGMLIAQLCLVRMAGAVDKPYGTVGLKSHYNRQLRGPVASKSHTNFVRELPDLLGSDDHPIELDGGSRP